MFHNTPCGSVYNPQFSKEHIMNIIKHKALQKLKKIESEVSKFSYLLSFDFFRDELLTQIALYSFGIEINKLE